MLVRIAKYYTAAAATAAAADTAPSTVEAAAAAATTNSATASAINEIASEFAYECVADIIATKTIVGLNAGNLRGIPRVHGDLSTLAAGTFAS